MYKNRIINFVTIASLFILVLGGAVLGILYGEVYFPETSLSGQQEIRQSIQEMTFEDTTSFDFEKNGLAYHVSFENGELTIDSEAQSEFVYICGFLFAIAGFAIWFFATKFLYRKCGR